MLPPDNGYLSILSEVDGRRWVRALLFYRAPEWLHILPLPLATFDAGIPLGTATLAAARGIANAFAILAFGFLLNAVEPNSIEERVAAIEADIGPIEVVVYNLGGSNLLKARGGGHTESGEKPASTDRGR